ncbi:hypothetical protein AWB77_00498 [Caballeronia fortuita]|uniref:Uncharacterized protein n=1 Tax=Caballeronia fortuita TaxID=1777138 RepID=A0A157ZBL4_9BURK|nr:hypothetical protein AWB77_00498 [Caballeronia fortuita]
MHTLANWEQRTEPNGAVRTDRLAFMLLKGDQFPSTGLCKYLLPQAFLPRRLVTFPQDLSKYHRFAGKGLHINVDE